MDLVVKRFEVHLVTLDPTVGHEMQKTRPCVILSPDEMNQHIATVIVAPLTSSARSYPTRVNCVFQGRSGQIVLDQIRTVDKARLVKRLGALSATTADRILDGLAELFAK